MRFTQKQLIALNPHLDVKAAYALVQYLRARSVLKPIGIAERPDLKHGRGETVYEGEEHGIKAALSDLRFWGTEAPALPLTGRRPSRKGTK